MMCEKCQKNYASVHMQQFINGQKVELHLCQNCAFKIDSPEMIVSLENIFKGFLDQLNTKFHAAPAGTPKQYVLKACTRCGMTFKQFQKDLKLGCETCYVSFAKEVDVMLKSSHSSNRHEGKYPRRMGAGILNQRQVSQLREQLKKFVKEENFEEAARLRDEIRALEG